MMMTDPDSSDESTADTTTDASHATDQTVKAASVPVPVARLRESFRFDQELATILTRFQYQADGIDLTANAARPLPSIESPTAGVGAVFDAASSLVFVCYDDRGHRTINPVETTLIETLTTTVADQSSESTAQPDATTEPATAGPLGEGLQAAAEPAASALATSPADTTDPDTGQSQPETGEETPSVGVVTPHNAQRGALETVLSAGQTVNTVEKYQGGERDIMVVSGTVSDPGFARQEESFLLDPRRLLVAISRARLLSIVVCSTSLFGIAPEDSDHLATGPVWARLFTQAVGRDTAPAWAGPLTEFVGDENADHANVPVQVYASDIDTDRGDR